MANLTSLEGRKGLVADIANEHSITYGCAKAFHDGGADLAITYLNEKAEPCVRPLAESVLCKNEIAANSGGEMEVW